MKLLSEHGLQAGFIPLRSSARRPPLFVIQDRHSVDDVFDLVAERGNAGFPIYGLQAWAADISPLHRVDEQAPRLLETILAIQSQGPYRLAAWPGSARVAYEIATRLTSLDHCVDFIGMVGDGVRVDTQADLPQPSAGLPIYLFVGADAIVQEPGRMAWRDILPASQLRIVRLARSSRPEVTPSRALARALSAAVTASSGQKAPASAALGDASLQFDTKMGAIKPELI